MLPRKTPLVPSPSGGSDCRWKHSDIERCWHQGPGVRGPPGTRFALNGWQQRSHAVQALPTREPVYPCLLALPLIWHPPNLECCIAHILMKSGLHCFHSTTTSEEMSQPSTRLTFLPDLTKCAGETLLALDVHASALGTPDVQAGPRWDVRLGSLSHFDCKGLSAGSRRVTWNITSWRTIF